ncbi:hypothetical protein HB779_22945 (plasmid) [Phyllobacterium sp. 628]|uniref:hypothetical protein n=1 Tax=Phyllobacterium sp. 628 TaxID=2718938 RepID=UPI00166281CA|nr:hypothetical protein [Phyllobacterium sp. 628]QND54767.1 hypothetical protein HB779_22945 [Phyllobacterium sp. 628]
MDSSDIAPKIATKASQRWQSYYAWLPVWTCDDTGIFWLETVWRARDEHNKWQYKSRRTEDEKNEDLITRVYF